MAKPTSRTKKSAVRNSQHDWHCIIDFTKHNHDYSIINRCHQTTENNWLSLWSMVA